MVDIRPVGQPAENPYNQFAVKATLWGSRDFLSARIDQWGQQFSFTECVLDAPTHRGYSDLFNLNSGRNIQLSDLRQPTLYAQTVSTNFQEAKLAFQDVWRANNTLFPDWSPKDFGREVLWESNIHPITDTWKRVRTGDFSTVGSCLARALGLGYMGFDTIRESMTAYQKAEQEGHSPCLAAGGAFLKTGLKNLALWEIAGIGFVFGCKLLPAIGCIPVGGILAGVGLACTVEFLARKCLRACFPPEDGSIRPKSSVMQQEH
jgi:hypothetical protein